MFTLACRISPKGHLKQDYLAFIGTPYLKGVGPAILYIHYMVPQVDASFDKIDKIPDDDLTSMSRTCAVDL